MEYVLLIVIGLLVIDRELTRRAHAKALTAIYAGGEAEVERWREQVAAVSMAAATNSEHARHERVGLIQRAEDERHVLIKAAAVERHELLERIQRPESEPYPTAEEPTEKLWVSEEDEIERGRRADAAAEIERELAARDHAMGIADDAAGISR